MNNRTVSVNFETDDEWTIHALNIHGYFFESYCRKVITDSQGWKVVEVNFPVVYPPPDLAGKGNESSLDIRAELRTEKILFTLLIECKKRNPNFVNWIFFPKQSAESVIYQPVVNILKNIPRVPSQSSGWYPETMLTTNFFPGWTVAEEARETRGSYLAYKGKSEDKTITSNTCITAAANQVALATQCIVKDENAYSEVQGNSTPTPTMPYNLQVFVPVILTNAKLFTCSYDPSDIDPSTGEIIVNKPLITSCSYLFYEYPLPRHLQLPPKDLTATLNAGKLSMFSRMDTLVINIHEFPKFLASLATTFRM